MNSNSICKTKGKGKDKLFKPMDVSYIINGSRFMAIISLQRSKARSFMLQVGKILLAQDPDLA